MATRTAEKVISLSEDRFYSASPLSVDREKNIIANVKIIGEQSQNGRRYSRKALDSAVSMYEGCKINLDHPTDAHKPRSVSDRFGKLQNVRSTTEGVFGDLHFLGKHPFAELVMEAAEKMPDAIGLSHNADGVVVERNGESVVEQIKKVRHVDIVADPASTRGLFEQKELPMKTKTLSEVRESLAKDSKERGFLQLLEDDGMLPPDTAMPADAAGDDPVEAAFKAAMNGFTDKLYNGSITDEEFLGKMKDLVKMRTKMADMSAKKDAASTDTTPVMAGKVESPSDPGTVKLLERLTYLENKDKARAECKTAKFDPSDSLLEALVLLPEPKRKALIEEQKKLTVPALPRTRSSTLTEGLNGNPKTDDEWLALIL